MTKNKKIMLVGFLALLFGFSFYAQPVFGAEKSYVMKGTISAIESENNTVVVEVPLAGKRFTVGGPLSPGAVLKRGGSPAQLSDFKVGEIVTVGWKATENGHVIERLLAK